MTEKKAPARHPTMEGSSLNSDASGGQSAEEMGDLQTFLINFSPPKLPYSVGFSALVHHVAVDALLF